jgi:hypothetical protein
MTVRKKYILIISSVIVAVGLAIGIYVIVKHALLANEPVSAPTLQQATVTVDVTENGQDGLGMMSFGGDCREETVPSQEGSFSCTYSSLNPIELTGISYTSYLSNTSYRLPIIPKGSVETQPIILANEQSIQLFVDIDTAGSMTLRQYIGNQLVTVSPSTGISLD